MTAAVDSATKNWWLFLLQGVAILLLGILLITNTAVTVTTLVVLMGIYWFSEGIFSIIGIFGGDSEIHWGWLLARGIPGILAGIYVVRYLLWPAILGLTTLVIIIVIQGIIMGVISLIRAFKSGWGAGMPGAINIILGIILLSSPLLAVWVLPVVGGIFGITGGISLIFFSVRVRKGA